jgi:hypothetical protein
MLEIQLRILADFHIPNCNRTPSGFRAHDSN